MKISIVPDDYLYPTSIRVEIKEFDYGDDVNKFCKKLEEILNDLMNLKKKYIKGKSNG